jgi:FtsH-binding integral membrane protein
VCGPGSSLRAVVSRMRAFTIAAAWILAGLAVGILALAAATGAPGAGLRTILRDSLTWVGVIAVGCLVVAAVWVSAGARNARSSAGLGGQAALFGLAAALVALLLLAVAHEALGEAPA